MITRINLGKVCPIIMAFNTLDALIFLGLIKIGFTPKEAIEKIFEEVN